MKLGTVAKIFVGIGTALILIVPIAVIILYLAYFFSIFPMIAYGQQNESLSIIFVFLPMIFIFSAVFMQSIYFILRFIMIIFYLVHVILNKTGTDVVRILCAIGFCFLPFFAMPIYFIIYILKAEPPRWALAESNQASGE